MLSVFICNPVPVCIVHFLTSIVYAVSVIRIKQKRGQSESAAELIASSANIRSALKKHTRGRLTNVVPAKDFEKRMVVEIDGQPHMIEQITVQTPSARGAATLYKIAARNLKTRARVEKAFRGTDALPESRFERRSIQYLYRDGDMLVFMDETTYDQFTLPAAELAEQIPFMTENMAGLEALVVDDQPIAIQIPDTVDLMIVETAPGVRGNSATGRTKPARLSTGHTIQVPEHLDQDILVKVDTRTGEYLGRVTS
jgi:elongation factor P